MHSFTVGFFSGEHIPIFWYISLTSHRKLLDSMPNQFFSLSFLFFFLFLFFLFIYLFIFLIIFLLLRLFRSNFKLIENCTKKIIFSNPYLLHYVVKMPVESIFISIMCAGDMVRV